MKTWCTEREEVRISRGRRTFVAFGPGLSGLKRLEFTYYGTSELHTRKRGGT